MDINELIGERISQARTRRGWNQSELARQFGKATPASLPD